jgi:hypothetical protein
MSQSHDELLLQHGQHVSMGYEGIMIKKISNGYQPESKEYNESLYRPGKSNHILKYKDFVEVLINHIENMYELFDDRMSPIIDNKFIKNYEKFLRGKFIFKIDRYRHYYTGFICLSF